MRAGTDAGYSADDRRDRFDEQYVSFPEPRDCLTPGDFLQEGGERTSSGIKKWLQSWSWVDRGGSSGRKNGAAAGEQQPPEPATCTGNSQDREKISTNKEHHEAVNAELKAPASLYGEYGQLEELVQSEELMATV